MLIEVCIDSIESLALAQHAGAGRIELCSSLATGGLTPSAGYMKQARALTQLPIYSMIRPREGDFLYTDHDINIMLEDIYTAKQIGLDGVVFGVLTAEGNIDQTTMLALFKAAKGLGITFHRAIDHCTTPFEALEFLMTHNAERVLSSGLSLSAEIGMDSLKEMVNFCQGRLSIMPGAGITPQNIATIAKHTGANEFHLSGKSTRQSLMEYKNTKALMGKGESDFDITVTDPNIIKQTIKAISGD